MENIRKKLQQIPKFPGVYIFKDSKSNVIYIGKASKLFNRVKSYFSTSNDIKTTTLSKKINDIEYFVTENEVEALLLENNLIKKYQPRYNIKLRDAKSYPMLKITKEILPRIIKCREKINEKDEYFGPYISVLNLKILQKIFIKVLKIRSCKKKFKRPFNYTPCLNYHIDKCSGPCASLISEKKYLEQIETAREILQGNTEKIITTLTDKMAHFSTKQNYETAAKIRDQIKIIKEFNAFQYIDTQQSDNSDYLGFYSDFKKASISVIQERDGKIIGKENFIISNIIDFTSILSDFIATYYLNTPTFPKSIYIEKELDEKKIIEKAIKISAKMNLEIKTPASAKEKKLVILAKQNAEIYFEEKELKLERIHELRELKKALNLSKLPRIIEGMDVATLNGKYNTGALVRFVDGKPNKTEYRQFNIKGEGHPDDFSMIEEVTARRYQRLKNEKSLMPDLILVDGGKPQVKAASNSLSDLDLNIEIIGLAKKNEYIFKQNESEPIILPKSSQALKLLQKVRDEAHRFSNIRLNKRYIRKNLESKLISIKGLGKKRINLIFKKFGSINTLANTDPKDIADKIKISIEQANTIITFVKKHQHL